ncbi:hypothetical protein VZ94_05030 [Methylocucumis oryzae]|uniref:DUF6916 domain-containing protein n=2 Tax=Methylocucumis oryzae TaxID=1632867 RepID=A0A0F3IKZ6_9GAMM|nr:hypothetical protein VZ94_05030 [Methylocucumis oryzae]
MRFYGIDIMLDTISADDLTPYINRPCRVTHVSGHQFELVIASIEQKPNLPKLPNQRAPFSVLLSGALEPAFVFGMMNLEVDTITLLTDVHIERILPPFGTDPNFAYYQIIFN